jgi:hypothetical protein
MGERIVSNEVIFDIGGHDPLIIDMPLVDHQVFTEVGRGGGREA